MYCGVLLLLPALMAASARGAATQSLPPRQADAGSTTDASLLPLATTFTPPLSCFTEVSLMMGYGYPAGTYSPGLGPGSPFSACSPCWLGLASESTCFPSGYGPSAAYSPGPGPDVCPGGYSVACSSVVTDGSGTPTATLTTCCPSGYLCAPQTRIESLPWYSAQPCSFYPDTFDSITALSIGADGATATSVFPPSLATGYAILANSVLIRREPAHTGAAATTSTTNGQGTAQSGEPSSSSGGGGLSTGAKAGIGVGAGVGGLLVIIGVVIIYLLLTRRAKPSSNPAGPDAGNNQPYSDKQVVAPAAVAYVITPHQEPDVSGAKAAELHGFSAAPKELAA